MGIPCQLLTRDTKHLLLRHISVACRKRKMDLNTIDLRVIRFELHFLLWKAVARYQRVGSSMIQWFLTCLQNRVTLSMLSWAKHFSFYSMLTRKMISFTY